MEPEFPLLILINLFFLNVAVVSRFFFASAIISRRVASLFT